jgi:uncharacterized membrane protein SpoIIM required for sporulation
MVLESLLTPFRAEQHPRRMFFLGLLYVSVALFLSIWIFRNYASMVFVFLATIVSLPLIYSTIMLEEEKDMQDMNERFLLKEHGKALSSFMYLFLGMAIAGAFWYTFLPQEMVHTAFEAQTQTINSINGRVTGFLSGADQARVFSHIFLNNVKVLVFCILFSFLYGAGALFILAWNASVISVAIGNFIRTQLAALSGTVGLPLVVGYFQIVSVGIFKYAIHGIPEVLAYFIAALAGGIISVAVIRHDFGTRKFEHVMLDSADLLLLSIFILFVAGLLEVYVTPVVFG